MSRIFISYRRQDARGDAERLADNLQEAFGEEQVFRDIDGIEASADSLMCGCHGYAVHGTVRPNGSCAIGYEVLMACGQALPRRRHGVGCAMPIID